MMPAASTVQVLAAHRAQPGTTRLAQERGGELERERVPHPCPQIEHALLDELATGKAGGNEEDIVYGIMPRIGKMLGWLVRHDPAKAGFVMNNVVGEADRRLEIPRGVAEYSLEVALEQDGGLDHDALAEFFRLVLSPAE